MRLDRSEFKEKWALRRGDTSECQAQPSLSIVSVRLATRFCLLRVCLPQCVTFSLPMLVFLYFCLPVKFSVSKIGIPLCFVYQGCFYLYNISILVYFTMGKFSCLCFLSSWMYVFQRGFLFLYWYSYKFRVSVTVRKKPTVKLTNRHSRHMRSVSTE